MSEWDAEKLLDVIRHRRSFKPAMLKPDPVERSVVEQVLEAGRWALNHGRTEPWFYTVYAGDQRQGLADAFADAYRMEAEKAGKFVQAAFDGQREKASSAPVWIAIGMKPGLAAGKKSMPPEEEMMAVACSVQLMHLEASALGLGAQWTTGGMAVHEHVARFVGLEPPARLLGFFYLGWPAVSWPEAKREELESHVRWA